MKNKMPLNNKCAKKNKTPFAKKTKHNEHSVTLNSNTKSAKEENERRKMMNKPDVRNDMN